MRLKYMIRVRQTIPKDESFEKYDDDINKMVDLGWEIAATTSDFDEDRNFDTVIGLVKELPREIKSSAFSKKTMDNIMRMMKDMEIVDDEEED